MAKQEYLNPNLPVNNELVLRYEVLEDEYVSSFSTKTYQMFLEGLSRDEIKRRLIELSQESKRVLTEEEMVSLITLNRKTINEEYDKDREFTVSLHLQRYNDDILSQLNIDVSDLNKFRAREVKNYAYLNALELLFQKEKLIGLHNKSIQMRINNVTNTKVKIGRPKLLRLNLLTTDELIELNTLMEKCKKNEGTVGIIMRPKEEKTIDIVHEVVEDETVNVESIEEKILPAALSPDPEPQTLIEVQDKLKEALRKRAEEAFKNAKKG
jgi:hypothetical protein